MFCLVIVCLVKPCLAPSWSILNPTGESGHLKYTAHNQRGGLHSKYTHVFKWNHTPKMLSEPIGLRVPREEQDVASPILIKLPSNVHYEHQAPFVIAVLRQQWPTHFNNYCFNIEIRRVPGRVTISKHEVVEGVVSRLWPCHETKFFFAFRVCWWFLW